MSRRNTPATDTRRVRSAGRIFGLTVVLLGIWHGTATASEMAPTERIASFGSSEQLGRFSDRTLVVGVEIDRDEARVVGFTVKPRPFVRTSRIESARPYEERRGVQVEVILIGPAGERYTQRVDAGPICLSHGAHDEPHIEGDTIRLHRDSFLVELPERAGFDRIEVAYHGEERGVLVRKSLGSSRLTRAKFDAAAGPATYGGLAIAGEELREPGSSRLASTVIWPEDVGDPDLYLVYGDPAEVDKRINVVIVPDGYRVQEKATMESHAAAMVAHFRAKTPHAEHDLLYNYILVYAYSMESGTDQCDCGIVVNTAMGTRFPSSNPTCGHSDNRCLSYGGHCDTSGTDNIVTAELRAPAQDETVVMVNTSRYGGCGGSRATYSAGNSSALELAVHELGHSMSGLADEYFYNQNCGSFAGEINTSTDAVTGAWPEWVSELGRPQAGGQYYGQCIYRPAIDCEMRNLGQPFCAVCSQHWSLWSYGHFRVQPTAPLRSMIPDPAVNATTLVQQDFSITTRLPAAPATNEITWTLDGPGFPGPTVVAGDTETYAHNFTLPGQYTLSCSVIAATNFIKPSRYGANQDVAVWTIDVTELQPPAEVAFPGSAEPLRFIDKANLAWQDGSTAGAFTYNLYRGMLGSLGGSYGSCRQPDLDAPAAIETAEPLPGDSWFYLVTGKNPAGEGPLGQDSGGAARANSAPCP